MLSTAVAIRLDVNIIRPAAAYIRSAEESILFEAGSMLLVVGTIRAYVLLIRGTLVLGRLFFGKHEWIVVPVEFAWSKRRTIVSF